MSTPEDRRAAWIALMSSLEAQLTITRENARAQAQLCHEAGEPSVLAMIPEWESTAWAASQLLRDLRVIPAPVVPRDDVTGQATLDDLVEPSSTPGDESVEEPRLQCPECLNGKHPNCDGVAYDEKADDTVPCACPCLTAPTPPQAEPFVPDLDDRPVIDNDGDVWTRQSDGTWKGTWGGRGGRRHSITLESRQAVVDAWGERGEGGAAPECTHEETRRFREDLTGGPGRWHEKCLACGIVTNRGADLPRDAAL